MFGFLKNILAIRHRKNNILTSTFLTEKQSDKDICNVCDQIQEEYECCNIQCCSEKSSESLESLNCNFCCKSEKVSNASKNRKPYSFKKQHKTVDRYFSSNLRGRRKSSENNTIHSKLACIIKRLNHLIETCPSRRDTSKNCSATDQPASITAVANPHRGIICASKTSCNKEPFQNECEKQPQKNIIPAVNTCAMPVFNNTFSLPETRSPNDCLAVVQRGVTIGYIMYSKIDPRGISCSKSSCNIEPFKNDCEEPAKNNCEEPAEKDCEEPTKNYYKEPSQEPFMPVNTCFSEMSVKCPSETKIQHNSTQSITRCPEDIPSKRNLITPVTDCSNEKSCTELPSIGLCAEVKDKNQKQDHTVDNSNNGNVIKDDETNKNAGTKDRAKPKPQPAPVKTIKSSITKPKTSNKPKPGHCNDEIKMKPNSKHNKLNSYEKKNINKR